MQKYYTYAYLRENGTPYYIGKGTGRRAYHSHPRVNGKKVPLPKDKSKILILKRFDDEQSAFLHETYMIYLFGRKCEGGLLLNLTLGGGGSPLYKTDEERKNAIRKSSLKYYHEKVDKNVTKLSRRKQREDPEYRKRERFLEKERRKNNPEKEVEKRRKRYEKNKELVKQKRREFYQKNKELEKQKRREYYQRTKDNQIANETQ